MVYIRDAEHLKHSKERNSLMMIATTAYCGFRDLGESIERYTDVRSINPTKEDIVVGSIGDMQYVFSLFDISLPVIDYPTELKDYFGRKMWMEPSLRKLIEEERTGIFIKPAEGMKKTTGKVISKPTDYCNLSFEEDFPMMCSEIVDIVSEWRCYVRYGELLAIKNYAGDSFAVPSKQFVHSAIHAYTSAPAGYSLDVGVLRDGKNMVVEINDGYSLGAYGINPVLYAKLLSARFSQLMGVKDCFH